MFGAERQENFSVSKGLKRWKNPLPFAKLTERSKAKLITFILSFSMAYDNTKILWKDM